MKSLAELEAIKNKMKNQVGIRTEDDNQTIRIVVGMATCGIAAGARPVLNALVEEVGKRNLSHVTVAQTGCIGMCKFEPIIEVLVPNQEKVTYIKMTPEKALQVVSEHIVNGRVCKEYTIGAAQE
ncbi:MAG: (2Fe-2S) ferredoxin domain-containing protein [Ruminococcaceae bacterium]|nr:(2Fe-2S) ferredoxin domain-containing protein [Oscillospiraceae bacterium]